MNIFQTVIAAVGAFFSCNPLTQAELTLEDHCPKRSREEDDDVVVADVPSPPKRLRALDDNRSTFEIVNLERKAGPVRNAASTQTYSKYLAVGSGCGNDWISLVDDDSTSLSPTKFKNTYKAPKHVRYTFKRRGGDVPRSRDPLTSMVPRNRNIMVPAASSFQLKNNPVQKRSFSLSGSSRGQWTDPPFGGGMNKDDYEKLLGSIISNSAKESMRVQPVKQIKNSTIIDLTDDDDETPVVDLTVNEARWPSLAESSLRIPTIDLTKKSTTMVKPNITYIDDSENVSPRQRVSRVNSFGEKIEKNKFTRPNLVSDGLAEYNNYIMKFKELEAQHKASSGCGNKFSSEALADLLQKRIDTHLKITESVLLDEAKEEVEEKPVLTDDMLAKVNYAFNQSLRPSQVLVSKFKLDITRSDFMTLKNQAWLNDAIINFYMELIVERGDTVKGYPSVYAFSTFFYPTLKNGYERVRRYTKKVDLFSKDIILVPIHLAVHWCMAKIDMQSKEIVYYDSMLQSNQRVLNMLLDYLSSEYKDKKKACFDLSGWTTRNDKDIPVQKNGSDCGVFACTFGEYSTRRAKFNFTQDDMPYMRKKMVYEILSGKLLVP